MRKKTFVNNALALFVMCLFGILSTSAQTGEYSLSMPDLQASGGSTVTVPVSLINSTGILSLQIDVFLPDGVNLTSVTGSDRIVGDFFDFGRNDQYTDDGLRYRRILIGNIYTSESAITGNDGELLYITLELPEGEGTYPIQLKNIQFFNPPTYAIETIADASATITAADYYFTIDDVQVTCGETVVVPLNLHNADGVYSIQIDLALPDGVEFVEAALGERVSAEFFQYGSEDKYTADSVRYRRTIFANLQNTSSTITGNEGVVLYYTLRIPRHAQESYTLRVMNVQYFNPPTYALHYIADAVGTINVSPTILLGDIDHSGKVDISDVTAMIDCILGGPGEYCTICGDMNADGNVAIDDITDLIDYILLSKN